MLPFMYDEKEIERILDVSIGYIKEFNLDKNNYLSRFEAKNYNNKRQNKSRIVAKDMVMVAMDAFKDPPQKSIVSFDDFILLYREAMPALEIARDKLKGIDKKFVARISWYDRELKFDEILERLDSMISSAKFLQGDNDKIVAGRRSDESKIRVVKFLIVLFEKLSRTKFAKSIDYANSVDGEKEFRSPGTEFIFRVFKMINPKITRAEIATAVRGLGKRVQK